MPFELSNFIDEQRLLSLRRHSSKFIKGNNLEIVNPGLVLRASTSPIKRLKITKSYNSRSGYLAPLAANRHAGSCSEDSAIDDDSVNEEAVPLPWGEVKGKKQSSRVSVERVDRQTPFKEKSLADHLEKMDKLNDEMLIRENSFKEHRQKSFQRKKDLIDYRKKVCTKVTSIYNNATAIGSFMRLLDDDRLWTLVQEARTMTYSSSVVPSSGGDLVVDYIVMVLLTSNKTPPSAQYSSMQIYSDSLSVSNVGSEEVMLFPPASYLEHMDGALLGYSGEAIDPFSVSIDSSLKSMSAAVPIKRDADCWVSTRSDQSRAGSIAGSRTPSLASLSVGRAETSSSVVQSNQVATSDEPKDDDTLDPENLALRIMDATAMSYPRSAPAGDIGDDFDDIAESPDIVAATTTTTRGEPANSIPTTSAATVTVVDSQNLGSSSTEELDGGSFITSLPGQHAAPTPLLPEISDNSTILHSVHSFSRRVCVTFSTLDCPSSAGSPLQQLRSPQAEAQTSAFNTSSAITHSLPAPRSQTLSGIYRAGSRTESIRELYSRGGGSRRVFVSMADRGLH